MIDTQHERELQARFDRLKACANCKGCKRTHKQVVNELVAIGNKMRAATTEAEHDALLDQWNLLRGESAAFVRKANEEFCRQHPEQCRP